MESLLQLHDISLSLRVDKLEDEKMMSSCIFELLIQYRSLQ